MTLLEVKALNKFYGSHSVLQNLSFTLKKREIVGLLGVNGAGKSTLMNILSGFLAPTSGEILWDGKEFLADPLERKKMIGYLPEQPPLYTEMTTYEYLAFIAEIRLSDHPVSQRESAINLVILQLGLEAMRHRLISQLSKGFRQRVGIASSLLGSPPLLIWDEPTAGLDPQQLQEIQRLIHQLKNEHTILLSSHMLHEIDTLCDRIIVIDQGSIITIATPKEIKETFQHYRIIHLEVDAIIEDSILQQFQKELPAMTLIQSTINEKSHEITITLPSHYKDDGRRLLWQLIRKYQWDLLNFSAKSTNLEESFLALTERKE